MILIIKIMRRLADILQDKCIFLSILLFVFITSVAQAESLSQAKTEILMKNYQIAIEILEKLAKNNDSQAQYLLGTIYRNGNITQKDLKRSAFWFEQASNNNYQQAEKERSKLLLRKAYNNRELSTTFDKITDDELYHSYFKAIRTGNLAFLKSILPKIDTKRKNNVGMTGLSLALVHRNNAAFSTLLPISKSIFDVEKNKNSILHNAIIYGSVQQTNLLLKKLKKKDEKTQYLVINHKNEHGNTPLIMAAKFKKFSIASKLVRLGVNIAEKNNQGKNVSDISTQKHLKDLYYLINDGSIKNKDNYSVKSYGFLKSDKKMRKKDIAYAQWPTFMEAAWRGNEHFFNIDFFPSQSLDSRDSDGQTALIRAARKGNSKIISALIGKKANALVTDNQGRNALHWAVISGSFDAVRLLMNVGLNINSMDMIGDTPLTLAVKFGYIELVRFLLGKGANIDKKNASGETALLISIKKEFDAISKVLLSHAANSNLADSSNKTVLWYAIMNNSTSLATELIGLNSNLNYVDENGDNYLLLATRKGNLDIVRRLITYGVSVVHKDRFSNTAMHIASYYGHEHVVDFLLRLPININSVNKFGDTALISAAKSSQFTIARRLVQAGANASTKNIKRQTALDIAKEKNNAVLVAFLEPKTNRTLLSCLFSNCR